MIVDGRTPEEVLAEYPGRPSLRSSREGLKDQMSSSRSKVRNFHLVPR